MKNLIIPRLYCPFPSKLNPHVEQIKKHTDEWVIKFGLCNDMKNYYSDNYSYFTGRLYPNAPYDRLCIVNDFFTLLFFIDDKLDSPLAKTAIEKEITVKEFVKRIMAVIKQEKALEQKENNPIFAALEDVWRRLADRSDNVWLASFVKEIEYILEAALWEYKNSAGKEMPTIEEYLEKRRYAGAANIAISMIDFLEEKHLPAFLKEHTIVQGLEKTACNIICISNDLFSLSKEDLFGDVHNLPSIIINERKITSEQAVLLTAEIHDATVHQFINLTQNLPSFDIETDEILLNYINILKTQIAGNVAWSELDTKRYKFGYSNLEIK